MKKLLILIIPIFAIFNSSAQTQNDWVAYNKTYYKIKVAETGSYTLDYKTLKEQGFPIDSINGNEILLINEGKEIPIYVSNKEAWAEGDYLEFYGKKLDGSFDTQLYEKPEHQLQTRFSMFTDTAVYFLTTGLAEKRINYFESNFEDAPEKEQYFMHEVVYNNPSSYNRGKPDGRHHHIHHPDIPLNLNDIHFGRYGEGEGYLTNTIVNYSQFYSNTKIPLNIHSIYGNGPNANIELEVVGISINELSVHHLQVKLNNDIVVDNTFDKHSIKSYQINNLPVEKLNELENTIEFSSLTDTAYVDRIGISYLSIKYPRSFDFGGNNTFEFYLDASENNQYIEFENLIEDQTYFLIDVTNQLKTQLVYLEDKNVHAIHLPANKNEKRHLYLYKANQTINIEWLPATNFTNYNEAANQGDYIIITHPQLENLTFPALQYANYRSSVEGGNYKPVVVNVEELYDLYSFGIAKHPLAIKHFLNDALENWDIKPEHCFLIGRGIVNYRAKHLQNWSQNFIPTFGSQASDQIFGAADFSPLSRIAIGRLNVTRSGEISNYLEKVKAVELPNFDDPCKYVKEQLWRHQILHIGSRNFVDTLYNPYNRGLLKQANIASEGGITASSKFLFLDEEEQVANTCKISNPNQLVNCMKNTIKNEGVKIISFLGGSNKSSWDIEIGSSLNYDFNNQYPIVIGQDEFAGNLYTTYFSDDQTNLPMEWLNQANKGATAYIGFNGILDMFAGAGLVDDLYEQMFVANVEATLGQQLNQAIHTHFNKPEFANKYAANTVSYSGDPALKYYTNHQPEIILNEENINIDIDHITDFIYHLRIQFQISYLNIPETQEVPYQIIQTADTTEEVVHTGFAKPNETVYYKNDFELNSNVAHSFTIELDYENMYNEICESNNQFTFEATEPIVGIEEVALNNIKIDNHPNPFSNYTVFQFGEDITKASNLEIISLKGDVVLQHQLSASSKKAFTWYGKDEHNRQLPAGVYWCYLKDVKGQVISLPQKVVLAR